MRTLSFSLNQIVIVNALNELYTKEVEGAGNNPRILQYAYDLGAVYPSDDTAWCALFVNWALWRSGCRYVKYNLLLARALNTLPQPVPEIGLQVGDVIVFHRGDPYGWQGHAGFFLNRNGDNLRILGGNQANMVKVAEYPIDRFLCARRPTIADDVDTTVRMCTKCGTPFFRCNCDLV